MSLKEVIVDDCVVGIKLDREILRNGGVFDSLGVFVVVNFNAKDEVRGTSGFSVVDISDTLLVCSAEEVVFVTVNGMSDGDIVGITVVVANEVGFSGGLSLIVIPAFLAMLSELNSAPVAVIHGSGYVAADIFGKLRDIVTQANPGCKVVQLVTVLVVVDVLVKVFSSAELELL